MNLDKRLFPNVRLNAGGFFQKIWSSTETGNTEIESTNTSFAPTVDLVLDNRLLLLGTGYSRNIQTQKSTGTQHVTDIKEDYRLNFGWRPEGYPPITAAFLRSNFFDKERISQDVTQDLLSVGTKYSPVKGLDVSYNFNSNQTQDKLTGLENRDRTHGGTGTYTNSFFRNRVILSSSYSIAFRETETLASGSGGEVSFSLIPFGGLSAVSDTPDSVALDPNQALIDGNLTATSGINIGLPPLIGGDTRPRNVGLDLLSSDTEVNALFVWVDRDLPTTIADAFTWDIYTSENNLDWTLRTTVSRAPFGIFQSRFEVRFPAVKTRFIKVVTQPLSQLAAALVPSFRDPDRINVTELQAFVNKPVAEARTKISSRNYFFTGNLRTKIFEKANVFHNIAYQTSSNGQSILSNFLTGMHRFSKVFAGNASLLREDVSESSGNSTNHRVSASLSGVPMDTLRHIVSYSGGFSQRDDRSSRSNSFSMVNTAQLYRGITANLNLGKSFATAEDGTETISSSFLYGMGLVPHQSLTVNLVVNHRRTDRSGGGKSSVSSTTERRNLAVSYQPFTTLYLSASYSEDISTGREPRTTQDYGVTWSPFPGGDLQLSLVYSESLVVETEQRNRSFLPSLRWNIAGWASVDLTYSMLSSDAPSEKSETRGLNANFRASF